MNPERIVTAMVLWSQIGIIGYLAGPIVGGAVAQAFGYQALWVVPLTGVALLLGVGLLGRRAPGSPN